jgi:hypothetical protein
MTSEIEDPSDSIKAGAKATANKASDPYGEMVREFDREKLKEKMD